MDTKTNSERPFTHKILIISRIDKELINKHLRFDTDLNILILP